MGTQLNSCVGMKNTQAIELSRLKGACSALVLEQMRKFRSQSYRLFLTRLTFYVGTVAAPANIPKMHYQDFYKQFTLRHHIVCDDWPIPSFCTPHKLGIVELRTLYDRLTNEDAPPLFRVLTPDEWKVHYAGRSTRVPTTNTATQGSNTVFVADGPSVQHATPRHDNVSAQPGNDTSTASTSVATNSSSQDAPSSPVPSLSSSTPAPTSSATNSADPNTTAPDKSSTLKTQKVRKERSDKNKKRPHATKAYKESQAKQAQAKGSSVAPQNGAANAPRTTGAPTVTPAATFTSVFSLSSEMDAAGPNPGPSSAAGPSGTARSSTPRATPSGRATPSVHGTPLMHGSPSLRGPPSTFGPPLTPGSPLSMYGPPPMLDPLLNHGYPSLQGFPTLQGFTTTPMLTNSTTSTRDTSMDGPPPTWVDTNNIGDFANGSTSANHGNGIRSMIGSSMVDMGLTAHTSLMAGSAGASFMTGLLTMPGPSSVGSSSTEGGLAGTSSNSSSTW